MPLIRAQPEDFEVEEILLYPPFGHGSHTYLWVEKRLATTDGVARALARGLAVPTREVGYAGRKDRRAVTRQWFSVPEVDPAAARDLELPSARVLEAVRHPQKLRVGQLSGNRFRLRVRGVDEAAAREAGRRFEELRQRGMANRFGRQRFGRRGDNPQRGARILAGERFHGDRRDALLMIAALQSAVFNRVLERRPVAPDAFLEGDLAVVHATGGHFHVRDPAAEGGRLASFEVSPTGPIFGTKMRRPRGPAAALEDAAMADLGLPPAAAISPPRGLRLYGDRRSLRVRPQDVDLAAEAPGDLVVSFTLPAGSYATVFMEELFPDGLEEVDGTGDGEDDPDAAH